MAPPEEGTPTARSLQETPTWALATVCFLFISISIFLEHSIHLLGNWLKTHRKKALNEAVERLKSELMLLGFMSLLLTVIQKPVSTICIPTRVADTMLPCRKGTIKTTTSKHVQFNSGDSMDMFWANDAPKDGPRQFQRLLDEDETATSDSCAAKDMVSLISQDGLHELQMFIFFLAVMQLVYSFLTMALGRAKMKQWKAWEKETQTVEYQVANAHLSNNNAFNFQKYIERSWEDDFKTLVGVSPLMWFLVIIFLLVDVHGWHVYLWVSYVPLIIVLVLGTKLKVIVARLALQIKDKNAVIIGTPLVQPNDDLFWFGKPEFVLTLLHFTLFTNAFELAFFIWVTVEYGLESCYHEHTEIFVTRIVLAVIVQVLSSYITLPLYALVTQMGSKYKGALLQEEIATFLKQWHAQVRERLAPKTPMLRAPPEILSPHVSSPMSPQPIPRVPATAQSSGKDEVTEERGRTQRGTNAC